jgi:hypothetical protein
MTFATSLTDLVVSRSSAETYLDALFYPLDILQQTNERHAGTPGTVPYIFYIPKVPYLTRRYILHTTFRLALTTHTIEVQTTRAHVMCTCCVLGVLEEHQVF